MARPKRQDERRSQLVRATALAISDRGLAGLRLRHIAEGAGVSIGTVLYYYPDLDALLVEVHEEVLATFYWERVHSTDAIDDPREQLRVMVEGGVPQDSADPTLRALYELHAAALRDESHAALLTTLWQREVSLYEAILLRGAEAGAFDLTESARVIAETATALEDAFDLHLAGNNDAINHAVAVERILGYLSLMTGCELAFAAKSGRRQARAKSGI